MRIRTALKWAAASLGVAVGVYAGYVATAWTRYGRPPAPRSRDDDPLLDAFMPVYDIVERHHVRVGAPADITFAAACEADLMKAPIVRAIFRARERLLGSTPDAAARPTGIVALTTSIGWRVLAEEPSREVVVGAVTQPWKANVVFRPLPPAEFVSFSEPDYVKIAWTLRVAPLSGAESEFITETRAIATDASARSKFRRYWSFLSPGIIVIRWMSLSAVKSDAESRARRLRGESQIA
jgi:hypothetical protein